MGKSRSPRAAARRQLIAELREIKSITARLIDRWEWNGRSTVWPKDRAESAEHGWRGRQREAHEYPEMNAAEWRFVALQCEHAVARLTQLAIDSRHMADAVRDKSSDPRT